jgi:hypothetical protein
MDAEEVALIQGIAGIRSGVGIHSRTAVCLVQPELFKSPSQQRSQHRVHWQKLADRIIQSHCTALNHKFQKQAGENL